MRNIIRMGFLDDIRESSRVVMSRNYIVSDVMLRSYRMGLIDNGVFDDDGSEADLQLFVDQCVSKARDRGEVCIIDRCLRYVPGTTRHVIILSAMYFGDIPSWVLFAIRHFGWYFDGDKGGDAFGVFLN